jgi:hypothetical protein
LQTQISNSVFVFLLSVSEISGYSSGYESEAGLSECPSVEESSEADRDGALQRRLRTKFTPEQINKLEKIFNKHKYLDAGERLKTAQKLNLSETQVTIIYSKSQCICFFIITNDLYLKRSLLRTD